MGGKLDPPKKSAWIYNSTKTLISIYRTFIEHPVKQEKDMHSLHYFQVSVEFMSVYTTPRAIKWIQDLNNGGQRKYLL